VKIEIGESLIRSWLRHVEGCQFAELNWKPSAAWPRQNRVLVEAMFVKAQSQWPEAFGKGDVEQFLKQAEVDVIGLNFFEGQQTLNLVDVAFHSGGLNYGALNEEMKYILDKYENLPENELRSIVLENM
jgi:hypothetical protein